MDLTDRLNSDVINEIINYMSPRDLFFYRQTNKYTYDNITNEMIINRAIGCIHNRLREIVNNYDEFVEFIEKRRIKFYGPFILQCLLGEYWDDFQIDAKTTHSDNIYYDCKRIDPLMTIDIKESQEIMNHNLGRYNYEETIDLYEHKSYQNQILLKVECDNFDYHCHDILKSEFTIKNGQSYLTVKHLNKIMNMKITSNMLKKDYIPEDIIIHQRTCIIL